ncbi:hypothetical protein DFH08DRAFT_799511 [Mycena albidolilacea]|uniref:Uncharacterized protein n=1 Tax=Mycena albidolilacea TaxID=1033008 RepID=A0AAD7AMB0_9AGAR|nr:hypothetical protein DFH08DRAFT_799511 [Mycena albidolilacea]
MQSILALELYPNNPRVEDIVQSIVVLDSFQSLMGYDPSPCVDYIAKNYSQPSNPRLEVYMIAMLFKVQHVIPNAEHLLSQAEKNFDSFDDPLVKYLLTGTCTGSFNLFVGIYFYCHYDIPRAMQFLRTALQLAVASKECLVVQKIANCEDEVGNLLAARSNAQKAQKLMRLEGHMYYQSLGLEIEAQARELLCQFLNLAEITIITGEKLDHIAQILNDQKEILDSMHNFAGMAFCDLVMAEFHICHGHTAAAQTLFLHHAQSEIKEIAQVSLERLASLKNWGATAIGWVSQWAHVFLAHAFKCQNKLAVHKAWSSMGHILLTMGDLNTTQSLFTVALEGFTWMDVHCSRVECMSHLGEIIEQRGDLEEAISCFKAARPLFEHSSQAKDVEPMDSLIRGLEEEIERGHDTQVTYLSALNAPSQDIVQPLVEMEDGLANSAVV